MKFTDKAIEIYTQHCKQKAVKVNGVDHISIHDAINALSIASDGDLADVVGQSEQLPCDRCKKLEFMIENGLGYEDMQNDI